LGYKELLYFIFWAFSLFLQDFNITQKSLLSAQGCLFKEQTLLPNITICMTSANFSDKFQLFFGV
jgi:hypothetical protein